MLEGLVAWIINTYVGKYVENLNTDQLSLGLLRGELELENLPLKKDVLRSLHLPFDVQSGFVSKVSLRVPLSAVRSQPWLLRVSGVYLVASHGAHHGTGEGEGRGGDYDEDEGDDEGSDDEGGDGDARRRQEEKVERLRELEARWESELNKSSGSLWSSLSTSILTTIIENVQLNVSDVHVRLEVLSGDSGRLSALGLCVSNVAVQNAAHQPQAGDLTRKSLCVSDLGLYWEDDAARSSHLSASQLQQAMTLTAPSPAGRVWLLSPVSAEVRVTRNRSALPLRSRDIPRLQCHFLTDSVQLTLTQTQYRNLVALADEVKMRSRRRKFCRWRPRCSVTTSPVSWWRYACRCHGYRLRRPSDSDRCGTQQQHQQHQQHQQQHHQHHQHHQQHQQHQQQHHQQRGSLDVALRRARDAVAYAAAYRRLVQHGPPLEAVQQALMERVEVELSFEEVWALREAVRGRLKREQLPLEVRFTNYNKQQQQQQQQTTV
ncbi:unnamed protein product [Lampetra planeri]